MTAKGHQWNQARSAPYKERNAAIRAAYQGGESIESLCERFDLKRARMSQILDGLIRPHERSGRTTFLGVHVKPETKEELAKRHAAGGPSVSQQVSDALDALTRERQ